MNHERLVAASARIVELAGVVVRFHSFALEPEVSERWPWQRAHDTEQHPDPAS